MENNQGSGVKLVVHPSGIMIQYSQLSTALFDYGLILYLIAPTAFQTMSQMCNHSTTTLSSLLVFYGPLMTLVRNKTIRNKSFCCFPECCHTSGVSLWPIQEVFHVYDHKTTII